MANNSIYSAFERMWQHTLNILNGKAPTSHATSSTTYGAGTSSNYGHVKLSDSTSSTSAASSGVAASPKAVKAAYDLANAAMPKSGGTFTGNVSLEVGADIVYKDRIYDGAEVDIRLEDVLIGYGETFSELYDRFAGCWIAFEDENGNPTTEPYIHWND